MLFYHFSWIPIISQSPNHWGTRLSLTDLRLLGLVNLLDLESLAVTLECLETYHPVVHVTSSAVSHWSWFHSWVWRWLGRSSVWHCMGLINEGSFWIPHRFPELGALLEFEHFVHFASPSTLDLVWSHMGCRINFHFDRDWSSTWNCELVISVVLLWKVWFGIPREPTTNSEHHGNPH